LKLNEKIYFFLFNYIMEQKENTEIIPAVNVEDVIKAELNCFTRISLMIKKYINCLCESSCNKK